MKKNILIYVLIFFCEALSAQKISCGIDFEEKPQKEKYDTIISHHIHKGDYKLDSTGIIIPVVVHIVWQNDNENLSDALILSQIGALNRDYNALNSDVQYVPDEFKAVIGNVGIHFCLAAIDPQGNPTTGIVRQQTNQSEIGLSNNLFYTSLGGSDAWNIDRYMNIWVANTGANIAGFGIYPWSDTVGRSGLVVNSPFFGISGNSQYGLGRVCVHEVGHYLGLMHLWGDVYDCSADDGVADTPPQDGPYYGCHSYPQYGCGASAMFMNFMDYEDDQCELLFTEGQKERMVASIYTYRQGLLNTNVQCIEAEKTNTLFAKVYPNPSSGLFNVRFTIPPMELLNYSIYNDMGELIQTNNELVNQEIKINISSHASGIYICMIKNNDGIIFKQKLVKE